MTQGVFVAVKHSGISYRRFSHFLPKTKTRLVKPPRAVFNLNDLCLGRDQTCLRIQAASEEVTQQLGNVVIGPPFFFPLQHIDWKVSLNSIQSQWWEHFHFPTKLSLLSFTVFWCVLIYYIHLPVPCRGRHSSALFWHETKLLLRDLNLSPWFFSSILFVKQCQLLYRFFLKQYAQVLPVSKMWVTALGGPLLLGEYRSASASVVSF